MDYPVNFRPRYGPENAPHPFLMGIIEERRPVYREFLLKSLDYGDLYTRFEKKGGGKSLSHDPEYNNGFLPGLDIITLYTMLAEFRPETYVEVGSGNSTRVAYRAIRDQHLKTKIISIDPAPRAGMDRLADRIIREPFENIDLGFIHSLKPNDILFIDNSHRILPNSDSMVFFLEVLPRLPEGVIVQIHDIYLPYDYPQDMCDRFYSEQYGLAIALLANPARFEILLPNFFISEDPELSAILNPVWEHPNLEGVERHGGSFWFRVRQNGA